MDEKEAENQCSLINETLEEQRKERLRIRREIDKSKKESEKNYKRKIDLMYQPYKIY